MEKELEIKRISNNNDFIVYDNFEKKVNYKIPKFKKRKKRKKEYKRRNNYKNYKKKCKRCGKYFRIKHETKKYCDECRND